MTASSSPEQIRQPPSHIVNFAVEASTFSPCRSKRGAALFKGDDLISTGYNYKPRAFACDGSDACKATCRVEAIHAEQHALLTSRGQAFRADMLHVKTVGGQLVPSGEPSCVQCSKFLVVLGVAGVWLYHADGWRRYEVNDFHARSLRSGGVLPQQNTEDERTEDQPRIGQTDADRESSRTASSAGGDS